MSKNVYIDKLDDMANNYNNTYHSTIKKKPVDVENNTYIDFKNDVNDVDPKFKAGDHIRISKYKNIFAKGYMRNWYEEIFVIKKAKNTVPWTYIINELNGEEIFGTFYEDKLQKTNQNEFSILIAGLVKKILYKMSQYFPKPYEPFGGDINVKVDLFNYATKTDIKNITHVDTSGSALKTNWSSLKTIVDTLDIDKLKSLPNDLSN